MFREADRWDDFLHTQCKSSLSGHCKSRTSYLFKDFFGKTSTKYTNYIFISIYTYNVSIPRFFSLPLFLALRVASTSHQTWSVQVGRVSFTWATLVAPPWFWTRHHDFVVFGCFRPGSFVEFVWSVSPAPRFSFSFLSVFGAFGHSFYCTWKSWVEHKKLIRQSAGFGHFKWVRGFKWPQRQVMVYFGNPFKHPKLLFFWCGFAVWPDRVHVELRGGVIFGVFGSTDAHLLAF